MALVETELKGNVAVLSLNRPEARNALTIELCAALIAELGNCDRSRDTRAVLLRGNGSVFCAGADFAGVSGPDAVDFLETFEQLLETLAKHRLPTVAAIQGAALGGGFQLASVCDFRIAATDARIGIPAAKIGIVVNFENVQRLVLLAGIASAKEILMTGRTFTGSEAATAGFVTSSVEGVNVAQEALLYASSLASLAPLAVQGAKRAVGLVSDHLSHARDSDPQAVARIDQMVADAYASADLQEGLAAFTEKRDPHFHGG